MRIQYRADLILLPSSYWTGLDGIRVGSRYMLRPKKSTQFPPSNPTPSPLTPPPSARAKGHTLTQSFPLFILGSCSLSCPAHFLCSSKAERINPVLWAPSVGGLRFTEGSPSTFLLGSAAPLPIAPASRYVNKNTRWVLTGIRQGFLDRPISTYM